MIILTSTFAGWYYFSNINKSQNREKSFSEQRSKVEEDPQTEVSPPSEDTSNDQPKDQYSAKALITFVSGHGDSVVIRTLIEDASSGNCSIKFTKAGQPSVEQTVPLALVNNYYACQGFNVPRTQFSVGGEWSFSIKFSGEGKLAQSETRKVVID